MVISAFFQMAQWIPAESLRKTSERRPLVWRVIDLPYLDWDRPPGFKH